MNQMRVMRWFHRFRKSGNLPVFAIFLFISFGFWFLNALRKVYVAEIQIPIHFSNIPSNKMVNFQVDSQLSLKIRADGFVMLRNQLLKKQYPLELDLDKLPQFRHNGATGVYCIPRRMTRSLLNQFSGNVEILEFQPDTLFISLSKAKRKVLDVKFDMQVECGKQHMVTGEAKVEPLQVSAKGSAAHLDTIQWIVSEQFTVRQATDTVRGVAKLIAPPGIVLEPSQVSVMIPVESYTEKTIYIDLQARNLSNEYSFKSFPTQVKVSFFVGLSQFNRINTSDFMAVVDFHDFKFDKAPERLKVRLEKVPRWIQNISYSPIFVEYLIEKERVEPK